MIHQHVSYESIVCGRKVQWEDKSQYLSVSLSSLTDPIQTGQRDPGKS